MIQLTENITYNPEIAFDEQTEEVKEHINHLIAGKQPDDKTEEPAGVHPRPLTHIWVFENFKVVRTFSYVYPVSHPANKQMESETLTLEEI